jgi:heme-degrading monooxygenase HmoA
LKTKTFFVLSLLLLVSCASPAPVPAAASVTHTPPVVASATNAPPATVTASPVPTTAFDKWSLWSGGTKLRGANIYQRRVYADLDGAEFIGPGPFGPPYTQADFDRLAALGANYVNISGPGLFTVEPPYVADQEAVANLDRLLEMIGRARMFAVITARSGPGRSEFAILGPADWLPDKYVIQTVWEDESARRAWSEMWKYTAERYRANPIVVGYDLMCEPNSNAQFDIWDPQEFYAKYKGTGYDWNSWYPDLVQSIRSVDSETPILVGGNGFSGLDWLPYIQPVDDKRVVYTFHQYEPHEYTHQETGQYAYPGMMDTDYSGTTETFDLNWLQDLLKIADGMPAPVAVNEYGATRFTPNGGDYLRDEMNLFEQHGWNYAAWMWYPAWQPMLEGDNSFNFRLGADVNDLGEKPDNPILLALKEAWSQMFAVIFEHLHQCRTK